LLRQKNILIGVAGLYYIDEKEEPWYHRDDAHSKTVATSTSKESVTSLDDLQLHFIVPSLS